MTYESVPRIEVIYRIPGQDAAITETVPERRMEQRIRTLLKHGRKIEEIARSAHHPFRSCGAPPLRPDPGGMRWPRSRERSSGT